jgi:hypothetical protein
MAKMMLLRTLRELGIRLGLGIRIGLKSRKGLSRRRLRRKGLRGLSVNWRGRRRIGNGWIS